jgi:CRISPR system Cascade subunit CasE
MYLSCLEIDTSGVRGRTWFGNPYRMHQRLLMAFDDGAVERLLFRLEERREPPRVIVQSTACPDWERAFADHPVLAGTPAPPKELALQLAVGQHLRFLLFANPTRRSKQHVVARADGRTIGKRVGLEREAEQRQWLERKGETGGFRLLDFEVRPRGQAVFRRGQSRPGTQTHLGVEFEGVLEVVDADRFRETLAQGIGSGKAFGFGLLSIAPAG